MTILPKKKVPKERLEDRASTSRGHGHNLHPSSVNNQLQQLPASVQYGLLSESSTVQSTANLENMLGSYAPSHVSMAGSSRSPGTLRLNGTPSPTTPQYDYLSHLNRNKKQKVYSDEEEIAEDDEIHHEIDHHLSPPNPPGVEDDGNNSDDERSGIKGLTEEEWTQKELAFAQLLKEKRGFIIKQMEEDGACLFRAVADQVLGDQEMHAMVRQLCMDYIERNEDYFSQYITEDFKRYVSRKRCLTAHGNHAEIQAMSEMYNRRIEVYQYDIDPINVFQGSHPQENAPIRVSYHMKSHYNSVVDPFAATIGVGLGLPNLQPGMAETNLITEAVQQSEQDLIEKQMLEDKIRATDWEATDEAIEQQIAQESYLEWLKQSEKRQNRDTPHDPSGPSTSSAQRAQTPEASGKEESTKPQDSPSKTSVLSQLNNLPPAMFGLTDWEEEDGDLLAQVLVASQAEYIDSLKPRDPR